MSIYTIVVLLLILALLGALPFWPHATNWGYYPSGLVLVVLVVLIVFLVRRV